MPETRDLLVMLLGAFLCSGYGLMVFSTMVTDLSFSLTIKIFIFLGCSVDLFALYVVAWRALKAMEGKK